MAVSDRGKSCRSPIRHAKVVILKQVAMMLDGPVVKSALLSVDGGGRDTGDTVASLPLKSIQTI